MADTVDINGMRNGLKILIDKQPYAIVNSELVKPGKGQAFTRLKVKNLLTGKVIERTFKSNERVEVADVHETEMRMLYLEGDDAVFMDDHTFEQTHIPLSVIGEKKDFLKEDIVYGIVFYNGEVIEVTPPIFLELKIVESAPGVRGDTASGRVMKPAILETGAEIQVPIFINEGEVIKVDTRTREYNSRAN